MKNLQVEKIASSASKRCIHLICQLSTHYKQSRRVESVCLFARSILPFFAVANRAKTEPKHSKNYLQTVTANLL